MDPTNVKITVAGLQDRKSFDLPCGGCSLAEAAAEALPPSGGYAVTLNGKIVPAEKWSSTLLQPRDELFFVPDFGDIVGGIIALATWMVTDIIGQVIITAGIMYGGAVLGGMLINRLTPKPAGEGPNPSQADSWDPRTTQEQGLAILKSYGKVRHHGNIIACHVLPSTDYMKLNTYTLVAFGEGPVKSVTDIRIDKQAYTNFTGVTVETRRGLIDQPVVSFFDKTRRCYKPNRVIRNSEGPFTWQTPGDNFDDVELMLRFNLWHYYSDGGQNHARNVTVKIEAKKSTDSGYTTVFDGSVVNQTGSGQFIGTNTFWRLWKLSDAMTMERGFHYDVKLSKTWTDMTDARFHNDIAFEFANEVLNDGFTYPGLVLAGISALRTEELSPPLDVDAQIEGAIVDTYDGNDWLLAYNPNPAWIIYDVLTQPVISGDGAGTPYEVEEYEGMDWQRIVDADWWELAQWCDVLCPDGKGGTEPRITFNAFFDSAQSLWDAVLAVCESARCIPYWRGANLRLAISKDKSRVGILSVGNILEGSFEETFLRKIDRASELEIAYNDIERDYERTILPIYSSSLTTYKSKVSLSPLGISKGSEGWRYGKFILAHNELLERSIKAQGDIDCIGYHLGDRLGVQHDVPNWNVLKDMGHRGGGRIISYTPGTNDKLQVDCDMTDAFEAGKTYEIAVRLHDADAPVIKTIQSVSGSEIMIAGQFTGTKPQADDLWAIGEQNLVLKDFVITTREQSEEHQFVLTLMEYDENLWAADAATPFLPCAAAVAPRSDRRPVYAVKRIDLNLRVPDPTLNIPVVDVLNPTNLKWNDNTPSGHISWSADDGISAIIISYRGIGYEIAPGNTDMTYVYWDLSYPNVFKDSNVRSDGVGSYRFFVASNKGGIAYPVYGGKLVSGQIVAEKTIGPVEMLNAMQPFMHDLKLLPGDNASENKHNEVHWAAGTIHFSDGSTQAINAGQIIDLNEGTTYYVYFSIGSADLQSTNDYASVATETTRLLSTLMISADAQQEIGILESMNTGGNWIGDFLAPNCVTDKQILAGAVIAEKLGVGSVIAEKIFVQSLSAICAQLGSVIAGTITGTIITGATLRTATSGKRIILDEDGCKLITDATVGKFGTFKFGDGTHFGSGYVAQIFAKNNPIPFDIQQEQTVADIGLYNRSSNPSGPAKIGQLAAVNGKLKICTVAGTPGTWTIVGAQS